MDMDMAWLWSWYIIQLSPEVEMKYPPLVTKTEGDNCFSICPVSE